MQRTAIVTTRRPLPVCIVRSRPKPLSKREQRLCRLQQVRDIATHLGIGWIGMERGKILVSFGAAAHKRSHQISIG
ncbi:MAG: hypothetical protein M3R61_09195, partial [Chloroflexota bacterium]|nr:hypothetical protein [Chloroflexota bacterium]